MPLVALLNLHVPVDERSALIDVVRILDPNLLGRTEIAGLLLQEEPQRILVPVDERKGRIVRSAEVTCLTETHWCTDVHVAGIDQQCPAGRALTIKYGEVIHVQREILDFQQLGIIEAIANAGSNR